MAKNQNKNSTAGVKPDKKPASIADYKAKSKTKALLELPSGIVIEVKNPGGMKMFMSNGVIPNSLMGIVQDALGEGTKEPGDVEDQVMDHLKGEDGNIDPKALDDLMSLIDNVTVACWVMPPVLMAPENEADKDPDLLYTDDIPEDDKMFVFQWAVGGTKDLEQFRGEHTELVDRMAGSSNLEG